MRLHHALAVFCVLVLVFSAAVPAVCAPDEAILPVRPSDPLTGIQVSALIESSGGACVTLPDGTAAAPEDIVTTGMYCTDSSGNVSAIAVMGDITGNGVVSLSQLVRLARAFRETEHLSGAFEAAGDLNGNGAIDLSDLVLEAALLIGIPSSEPPAAEVPEETPSADPSASAQASSPPSAEPSSSATASAAPTGTADELPVYTVLVTAGGRTFSAALENNACADAFRALLPLSAEMSELNGNEKFVYLPDALPANPAKPSAIEAGDLMLYGDRCIVLFYQSFETAYSYTRIGRIEDPDGLAETLGPGSVSVQFEPALS